MFNDLAGKRVLITGSTMGIGLATAQAFAALGAKVGINGRRAPENLASLLDGMHAADGEAAFFAADLSSRETCHQLVADFVTRFGGIDVLINNAGGLVGRKPLPEIDDDFFDAVNDLNMRSALACTQAALPYLKTAAQTSGQTSAVISVGSIAGHTGGGPGAALYGAAKAWLHNIHKNWVDYHTADGIRFNIVSPGVVDTAFHADKNEEVRQRISSGIPMGRFGKPEEVAPAFLFFASHACAGYITGQILDVNGGQFMP
ncbi:MAG: 3-ketoacyl-ACP synthase [Candidatus Dactylopiibacterium carminicum]|uniref:3-ketoacyl-ACP synthase n=1 Tax=Candidatus Dactylopiibacterium carminicum TaxID=857335 RepID=A0A272EUF1_9RHOO|nr:SDR family NAD(P)-dependent oxidoreductase [Candidatus Dactylopiibacterium carminicum]KAF7599740.1 NAD(P)-dependent oxidoreductase [Candidatus Dactylopiibacterium carminicum]PAS93676.1 MAG: 3-ketoacyl-ACP synthase [Candidatus Dactylopiibacterium carminicum]PAS97544.1 MAG: 3-ketoacyl-ACP synthase [Candidatus Dactylopiibacterium carminicum]PAS99705.1 MAG: 3-ketoacyl-ACP synthase [Candidatus Dactylopiibacterium carminicum]